MADDYIRKADAKDALQEKVFHNLTDEFYGAMQVLDELEPADVAPVIHSRWVLGGYDDMYYACENCEHKQSEYYHKPTAKYCPNCGAKMDGEKKE